LALQALDFYLSSPLEIAIVGEKSDERFAGLRDVLWDIYLPNRVIALCADDFDRAPEVVPLLAGRNSLEAQPLAYVCRQYACQTPVSLREDLKREIESARP